MLSREDIATSIRAELKRDEEQLAEAQKKIATLTERVFANRAWLQAYGVSGNGVGPHSHSITAQEGSKVQGRTIREVVTQIIRQHGPKTISDLYKDLLSAGKRVHRASLDATIRRSHEMFEMKKNAGRITVNLRESAN